MFLILLLLSINGRQQWPKIGNKCYMICKQLKMEYINTENISALTLCSHMSLIYGRMSPLTTTPTYQLAIMVSRLALPSRKLPNYHPYITTSYVSY